MILRRLQQLRTLTVNVVAFVALLELAGLGYFLVHDGGIYYVARGAIVSNRTAPESSGLRDVNAEGLRRALNEGLSATKFRISTYFGYNLEPNERISVGDARAEAEARPECKYRTNVLCEKDHVYYVTNNYGFDSVLDYPYRKQSADEYVIGIFGGSLSVAFAKLTIPELFDEILPQVPALHGKKFTLLSFAREGFKQPQSLAALSYFLSIGQRFDLVINLDGANEILHALNNSRAGVDYSMPADGQIRDLVNMFSAAVYQETGRPELLNFFFWKSVRERLLRRMTTVPLAGPALLLELGVRLAGHFEARADKSASKLDAAETIANPVFILPQRAGTTPAEAIEQSIANWRRSSLLMAGMLRKEGIPYLHVLQPIPYLSNKPFTEEEKRTALGWDKYWAKPMHDGYLRMLEEGKELTKAGVNFASATAIYDDVGTTIFTDECCHTNREGLLLLAGFIAQHIPPAP